MFSFFSHKKAKLDALKSIERSIAIELRTFTNHLTTVQMSYDIIIKLLEEKKQNGQ